MDKIALVTGANKGIGYEVARQLTKAGCTVLIGARNLDAGKRAASELHAEAIELDLERHETLELAAKTIRTKYGRLDILVNNAGIADLTTDGPPSKTTLSTVECIFRTNFFGTIAVTQAMLPLVKASASGRIVNVSSGLGSLTQNADPNWPFAHVKALGYCASKAALNMMTVQLAWELRDTKIKVNSADPGYTATDLNGNSGTQTVEEGSEETVRLALLGDDGPTGGYFDRHGIVPW